jgi:hypothetical protein
MPVLHRVVPVTVYGAAPPSQADSVPIPVVSPSIVAAQSVAPFTVMRAAPGTVWYVRTIPNA